MLRIRMSSNEDRNFCCTIPQSASLTAPFTQGSLGLCHAFGLLDNFRFMEQFDFRICS